MFHALRVSAIDELTADSVALTLDVPDDLRDEFAFEPGQHVIIGLDGLERRTYSLCTAPGSGRWQIGVKRLPGGAFSESRLAALQPGDTIDVMAPTGSFGPRSHAEHVGLIAAGSGITPILSIARAALAAGGSVTLLYASRNEQAVMFLDDLADLKDTYPERFHLVHVFSRQQTESELLSGRLDGDRLKRILGELVEPKTDWYLCGPLDMVTELAATLESAGATSVHRELFHVDDAPPPPRPADAFVDGGPAVTATLDGRTSAYTLTPEDDSVLAGLLRVRPEAPFACRGGVCGTCRAKVLDGAVEMRHNYALEPDELEAGHVLTCQSWPTTPDVTLSYE
ncbi:ring-1,2-phenylacetyl-CoA epoxidase subunit PaaE [Aeromicrobium panaciterrae]|uniref:Ring-1,2-phenylacetyl-CoA epoxidase subunit PaaE n=1 Tax=Aeromicrobium panaciterrae TaxID=363861 RepID=A0ABU1UNA9_9ACTN|nr:2Fe-2S iron-sulfur cluster-binding protein [Aeromicrobium panaciterrae]MDR7086650.1 ring-1,2-phenylacetyl-CoA epoxidase subunit PaaE [Aeromicrobium panaciterrae]